MGEEFYEKWKEIYYKASTALHEREKRLEEAAELIEKVCVKAASCLAMSSCTSVINNSLHYGKILRMTAAFHSGIFGSCCRDSSVCIGIKLQISEYYNLCPVSILVMQLCHFSTSCINLVAMLYDRYTDRQTDRQTSVNFFKTRRIAFRLPEKNTTSNKAVHLNAVHNNTHFCAIKPKNC